MLVTPKETKARSGNVKPLTREQHVLQQIDEFIQNVNSEEFTEHLTQKDVTGVFDLIQSN